MTRNEAIKSLASTDGFFRHWMSYQQRVALTQALAGEEGEYFADLLTKLMWCIKSAPVTYNTEDVETADKVLQLHYFKGGIDAWIVERDVGDTADQNGEGEQHQAFGKITVMGGGWEEAEWGYISIADLIANGVELDLHWDAKTVKEMA